MNIIRTDPEVDQECCPRAGGLPALHKIHRTLPTFIPNTSGEGFLQDEMNNAILDEQTNRAILDNYKEF